MIKQFIWPYTELAMDPEGVSISINKFNQKAYSDALFGVCGLNLPVSIQGSVIKRKAEFLAGRYCAKASMQTWGLDTCDIHIGKNRAPIWPESISGSISHSDQFAMAVTASNTMCVGVDIEKVVSLNTLHEISDHILNEDERCLVNNTPYIFTLIFSAKESFFKMAYPAVGRYFDFDAVSVQKIDLEAGVMQININTHLCDAFTTGMTISAQCERISNDWVVTLIRHTK